MADHGTGPATPGARALVATLACFAALLALTALRYTPPSPLTADAPPEVFSATRAQAELATILGDDLPHSSSHSSAHPLGSPANAAVRARIIERLSAFGYEVRTHTGLACYAPTAWCGMPVNILARLPGSNGGRDGAVLIAAHYDSVPAGPGASDDAAGVAAILEIARALKHGPPAHHDVILLIDDGEEAGLLGARLFVDRHPWAPQVKAAVNLEARGTSGPSFMFETGSANRWLMQRYGEAIPAPMTNSLYYAVYKQLPNDTDFTVFKAAGYQGYNFAFLGQVGHYHTPADDLAHLDPRSLQHQGDNALRTVRSLADAPFAEAAPEDAVYFDVFRLGLAQWPASAAPPLALLVLASLAAAGVALLRTRRAGGRELAWGIAGSAGALLGGTLAAAGLFLALRAAGIVPVPPGAQWIAHPKAATAAFAALAFAAASGIAALLGERPGIRGAMLGHALVIAALGVAVAIALPGASFLFLVPGLAAVLAIVAMSAVGPGIVWSAAAALPAVAACAVVLPLVYVLYDALGAPAWPITTAALLLATQALAPALVTAGRAARRRLFLAALCVVLGGLATTALQLPYSADQPQRINLEHRRSSDAAQAEWIAKPDGGHLPPALAVAAPFAAREEPGRSGRQVYAAAAPYSATTGPQLEILATDQTSDGIRYRLHLRSVRGAAELELRFPADVTIRSLQTEDSAQPLPLHRDPDGTHSITFKALPAAGIALDLTSGTAPLTMDLIDRSYDFPAEGRFLQEARGPTGTPSREGDLSSVSHRVTLPSQR
ncbi:MAG TPA: M20/M25/M40 family metallo-hydrolase [Aromatoleum sp.]|uniref:M20/M25/M40 family metallo-hydrolase n=1 Tax=Aromatoleum sp. TaxID=2307007 RepID=UPI002B470083|nr:M20/M25/M40 family metallo-hydrolase [Aromatoleum sp.]HJV26798.1 M20/M25/M40 family metallo-hydrolase [Aromatoleum sp.]